MSHRYVEQIAVVCTPEPGSPVLGCSDNEFAIWAERRKQYCTVSVANKRNVVPIRQIREDRSAHAIRRHDPCFGSIKGNIDYGAAMISDNWNWFYGNTVGRP
jgi:hypothetical protein